MSPDHWSKLTWDTVSAGGYDLFGPIGYLDRKRDRAYKQRVIVTPAQNKKNKLRAAYGKHCFMYNNFRFVGTQIWNYIIDHLDIKVSLPKFKKIFKAHIQSNNYNFQFR